MTARLYPLQSRQQRLAAAIEREEASTADDLQRAMRVVSRGLPTCGCSLGLAVCTCVVAYERPESRHDEEGRHLLRYGIAAFLAVLVLIGVCAVIADKVQP